jgi:hypothetical protein
MEVEGEMGKVRGRGRMVVMVVEEKGERRRKGIRRRAFPRSCPRRGGRGEGEKQRRMDAQIRSQNEQIGNEIDFLTEIKSEQCKYNTNPKAIGLMLVLKREKENFIQSCIRLYICLLSAQKRVCWLL